MSPQKILLWGPTENQHEKFQLNFLKEKNLCNRVRVERISINLLHLCNATNALRHDDAGSGFVL